ncbi:oligopeptide transporter [Candidatus Rickettsiella viridis]|uniref:Oligopeptide transporter n=1 Tax=Candidatus Rickettsiella viridis TaxID=676208 RepID=A0A2Z5V633_9COXI|nr:oligopeptide transporter, OPT family [Candidatus Rickettsiella viridis]BBB15862.1 oligopeptide transporter [Candidatus Rickettsiella viridis]
MPSQPTEITFRAVLLAIVLAVILAAANAYLGLKVGLTISASIPAAILSMGILRFFKNSSILENTIVQTGASAGEAVVAGMAFMLPALIILHYWQHFDYWQTVFIALTGGTLGVLFSIPLRRVLLADETLRFPEGTAIGQVLKISEDTKGNLKELVQGGALGAIIALFQGGFQIIADNAHVWFKAENKFIYGFTFGFEPALLAAGYIVGIGVALSTLLGVVIGWVIGVPIFSYLHPLAAHTDANSLAMSIWQSDIRPIGVGTMLVGGLWTMVLLIKPIIKGIHSSFVSLKTVKKSGYASLPKHERDIPIHYTLALLAVFLIPLGFILFNFISHPALGLDLHLQIITLVIGILFILITGFFFSSLSGYFAGLIGSSQSPISGVSLSVLLLASLVLLGLFHWAPGFTGDTKHLLEGEGLAIIIGALVSSSCAITNDTIQDLKAGQIVGATPWKQQLILIVGVIVSALVLAPTLDLLFNAYGIGGISPPGRHMDPSQMLAAPQAALMASLVAGAFNHNLPWGLISIGFLVAIGCILVDRFLQPRGMRLPVLAVGIGIYLPLDTSSALIFGGLASYFVERTLRKQHPNQTEESADKPARQRGLTLACGLVAGACLMGVVLAIPFTLAQSKDVLRLMPANLTTLASILGVLSTLGVLAWIYKTVCQKVN